jgi:hypothetical protein
MPVSAVRVDVRDAGSARLLNSLIAPANEFSRRPAIIYRARYRGGAARVSEAALPPPPQRPEIAYERTQIDARGDVLVTSNSHSFRTFAEPEAQGTASGWWGNATTHGVRRLTDPAAGTLSEGRIAYVTKQGGEQQIDVLNLATGNATAAVVFPGSPSVAGVGLRKTQLAWAQRSYGYTIGTGWFGVPCVDTAIGSVQLAEASLSGSGPSIVVGGPVPRPAGPTCVHVHTNTPQLR